MSRIKVIVAFTATVLAFSLLPSPANAAKPSDRRSSPGALMMITQVSAASKALSASVAARASAQAVVLSAQASQSLAAMQVDTLTARREAAVSLISAHQRSSPPLQEELRDATTSLDSSARSMYMNAYAPSVMDFIFVSGPYSAQSGLATSTYLSSIAGDRLVRTIEARDRVEEHADRLAYLQSVLSGIQDELFLASDYLVKTAATLQVARDGLALASTAVAADSAALNRILAQFSPDTSGIPLPIEQCSSWLARTLYKAGFRGENLREAWAIAMRESGGREDAVSSTSDYGMFQFNKPTWGSQPWWDEELILQRDYNATIAFAVSAGGSSWYSWGLTGDGKLSPGAYINAGWDSETILSHIWYPYVKWYNEYPCVSDAPASALELTPGLPPSAGTVSSPLSLTPGLPPSVAAKE